MSEAENKMLPFSRFAARLSRGRRIRRGDTLTDTPDPRAAVRALPADEFYFLITERGLPETQELLLLGSPDQVQLLLDFEAWDRDHLSPAKAEPWLAALAEAPPEQVYEWMRGLDVELVALLMRRRMRLYDLTLGEEPEDDPEGQFFKTPDGFFMIDALGSPDEQRVTQALLEALYSVDLEYARRILVGLKGELDSELEETGYRWRAGRLADLGFVDPYEALEVYAAVDPTSVKIGEAKGQRVRPLVDPGEGETRASADALRMPTALVETLSARGSRFARAVSRLTSDDDLAEVHASLVALGNRVLSADRVSPADQENIRDVFERMLGTLDLALEYLARGDEDRETEAVRTVSLVRLHRTGVALVAKVGKLARALVKENPFAQVAGLDLWEPEEGETLAPLLELRPRFPRALDDDPASGGRPFSALADIARATRHLESMAAQLALLVALGVRPAELVASRWKDLGVRDPHAVDAATLARTVLVGRLLGHTEPGLVPLTREDVLAFARLAFDVPSRALDTMRAAMPGGRLPASAEPIAQRWAASLVPLGPVLRAPDEPGTRRPV